jgi:hypothetical protein
MSDLIYLYRVLYKYWSIAFFKQIVDVLIVAYLDFWILKR